ncbi:MAG: HAMP domain-containing protein, partial [Nitrospirota bacterium]|nr:HAMP domain-containing protein [Nitrospirota bacterium]
MFKFIRKRLSRTVLTVLAVSVTLVMLVVIFMTTSNQTKIMVAEMKRSAEDLSHTVYAGIKHPMAVGDSASIEKELLDIKEERKNIEVFICDFNQEIIYSTDEKKIKSNLANHIYDKKAFQELKNILPEKESVFFEEKTPTGRYLLHIYPIQNRKDCFHCHGSSRKVLGSMVIKMDTEQPYAAIAFARNRTLLVSILGILATIALIYTMLTRLVRRPVESLARKSKRFAEGDMSVSADVTTEDEIGILGSTFNYMVKSIKDQIEYANSLRTAIINPLFVTNTDMVITHLNEACEEITGYTKEEVEGKMTCSEVFKSNICDTACPMKQCFEEGKGVKELRATITNREGEEVPIMISASPIKDSAGKLLGGLEIFQDITVVLEAERLKYVEEAAAWEEEQRKYLEARVKSLSDVLSRVSEGNLKIRTEVLEKNDAMDIVAQHINAMLGNLEQLYERISSFSKELELKVAERTAMLNEKTHLLEQANKELEAFAYSVSHDLRAPLRGIAGFSKILYDDYSAQLDDRCKHYLKRIGDSTNRMSTLIDDILELSRAGRTELQLRPVEFGAIINTVLKDFREEIASWGISIKIGEVPAIKCDLILMQTVFSNLISNAIKFTQGKERPEIEIGFHEEKDAIFVRDNGIGF